MKLFRNIREVSTVKERKILLSIIIPIYNSEKHLCECLDSLINQGVSPELYEILCIDDGSSDNSCRIIEDFSESHENIQCFHQDNSGVSVARNNGIKLARGNYIWFIDSDDYASINSLSVLLSVIDRQTYDRVVFRFYITSFSYDKYQTNPKVVEQLKPRRTDGSVCTSVYKRSFLIDNELYFQKGILAGEDSLFNFELYKKKGSLHSIENTLYFYRINESSVTKTKSNIEKILKAYLLCAENVKQYFDVEVQKDPRTIRYIFSELEYAMTLVASLVFEKREKFLLYIINNSLFPFFWGKPVKYSVYSNAHGFHLLLVCVLSKVNIFSWIIKMWAKIHNSRIRKITENKIKQIILKQGNRREKIS